VDESNIFDESQPQQQLGDGLAAETGMDQIEEEEEVEQVKAKDEKIDEPLNEEEQKVEMDGKEDDEVEKMEEATKEENVSADEKNIPADEKTTAEQEQYQVNTFCLLFQKFL
jgi:hypothetical protein